MTPRARVRLGFAALALLVVVPAAGLVVRTLQGVDADEALRRRSVAERAFDEMERALSELVEREEARPAAEYRRTYVPPDALEGGRVLSPLASPPALPFVVAYFELDPDGSVHSPLLPRPGELDPPSAPPPPRDAAETLALLERTVGPYFAGAVRASPGRLRQEAAPSGSAPPGALGTREAEAPRPSVVDGPGLQAPGTTVARLDPISPDGGASRAEIAAELRERAERQAKGATSAFEAMRSLNRGVSERAKPQAAAPGVVARRIETRAAASDAARAPTAAPAAGVFAGALLDAQRLVLHREVMTPAGAVRQGFLVDPDRLRAWLLERSGTSAIPGTHVSPVDLAAPPALDAASFRHRFAEPFDAFALDLALPALAPAPIARPVKALALALLLALAGGFVALYRMVSVALGYAERRNNFVAAVSHELKTPLTAIRLYGEMLRDGMVPSEAKRDEYHRTITGEAERLSRLIDNVLEHARLEKGTRGVVLRTGRLEPVVEELAALLRPHAERQGFALAVETEPDLPPVRYDRDALLQVLFNLVDNALKYAREAEPRVVHLRCARQGGDVVLCVRDHGPGVPARHLARVFEPFFRGGDELVRATTGTGIGLALVRGLATAMGARVAARPAEGGGFEVCVAFAPAEPA